MGGYDEEFRCVYFTTTQKFYLKRFIEISHKYAINIKRVRSFRQTTHFFQVPQSVSTHPTSISIKRFCNCGYFALTTLNKFTKMHMALICSAYSKGFLKRRSEILRGNSCTYIYIRVRVPSPLVNRSIVFNILCTKAQL